MSNCSTVDLFTGCGGMTYGLHKAGFWPALMVEKDKWAYRTLEHNRMIGNFINEDVANIDYSWGKLLDIDVVTAGIPCQSFSYAGNREGLTDPRGNLFYEFARAVKEVKPRLFLLENVKGLLTQDGGKAFSTILNVMSECGYATTQYRVLNANDYGVPQSRERLFLVGFRDDITSVTAFEWPTKHDTKLTLRDALEDDVTETVGAKYSDKKAKVLDLVPAGGCWRDLPEEVQKEYMGKSYYSSGGRTGMAKRLSWDKPSPTLTCSPAQKQTERCHPDETRPLTVREYARIQTFPDDYEFLGPLSAQYRMIGNAVPVELAYAIGKSLYNYLEGVGHEK